MLRVECTKCDRKGAPRLYPTAGGRTMKRTSLPLPEQGRHAAGARRMSLPQLVASINAERRHGNLSSAIRLFVLDFYYQLIPVRKRPHSKGANSDRRD